MNTEKKSGRPVKQREDKQDIRTNMAYMSKDAFSKIVILILQQQQQKNLTHPRANMLQGISRSA